MRRWRAAKHRARLLNRGNRSAKMSLSRFWTKMKTWMLRQWRKKWNRIYWKRWRNVRNLWKSSNKSFSINLLYKRYSMKKHPLSIEALSIAAIAASSTRINQSQPQKRPSNPRQKQLHRSQRSTEAKASSLKKWAFARTPNPANSSATRPSTRWL